jgi:hypothetical protein
VDQCTECRGIFLDRGELEKLVDAEDAHHTATPLPGPPAPSAPTGPAWGTAAPSPGQQYQEQRRDQPYRDHDDRYRDDRYRGDRDRDDRDRDDRYRDDKHRDERPYGDPRYRQKKKKSFLEELFD